MDRGRRYAGIALDVLVGLQPPRRTGKGVLVLGMHRSGTSAITSVLGLLGPELGDRDDLIAANEANRRGYWESRKLTEFQESLLQKLGGEWATPPSPTPGWERDWRLVRRIGLARRIFRDVYGAAEQWVWKDPRTVLLFPFWRRALRFDPIVVGIFRHPLEVADSLAERDGISKEQALRLWETYNRALLAHARGLPAFITAYEDLLVDPVAVVRALCAFLETQALTVRRPADDAVRSCVDADLRHSMHPETSDDLTDAQRELLCALRDARGEHAALGPRNGS